MYAQFPHWRQSCRTKSYRIVGVKHWKLATTQANEQGSRTRPGWMKGCIKINVANVQYGTVHDAYSTLTFAQPSVYVRFSFSISIAIAFLCTWYRRRRSLRCVFPFLLFRFSRFHRCQDEVICRRSRLTWCNYRVVCAYTRYIIAVLA